MFSKAPGAEDLQSAADQLAARIPGALAPLARMAFNYRWSWAPGGSLLFAHVDCDRWTLCQRNPVRLLQEASARSLARAAADRELVRRARALEEALAAEQPSPLAVPGLSPQRPVAFFCAEYGIHPSLPLYAGGLGVLAGDLLKAASDGGLPLVAVGLLYRQGYFRQRIDVSGWQQEYWVDSDPERLPAALVTKDGIDPLTIEVPIRGRDVIAQIWRIDVGRVPLYLLDTDRAENRRVDRWITSRLYVGDPETRLAQYALLGVGGARALRALGFDPAVLHLNEGHAALAPLELAAADIAAGKPFEAALAAVRSRVLFTTHTPVAAGNETYAVEEVERVLTGLPQRLGVDWGALLSLGRVNPHDPAERPGMTSLGLRVSHAANGVSRRHGATARSIWQPMFPGRAEAEVPIAHVTNGVHLATWMADPMRELLDRHLGPGWMQRTGEEALWRKLDDIPDTELWQTRSVLRGRLIEFVRDRATVDRLARGETGEYVELASRAFDPEILTIGFARRLATYKRMHLLMRDLPRSLRLLAGTRPVQILLAGKAHPADDGAKRVVQMLFAARGRDRVGERIAYLHDYDMGIAQFLVAGCDVWINVPQPPLEASGTSGMKAALNGSLNLSVLDGWWAEAYDGDNGWAIDGEVDADQDAQDARHADAVLGLIEREVVPCFYERDAAGVPQRWVARMRAAIRTAGRHFTARRMLEDYVGQLYQPPSASGGSR